MSGVTLTIDGRDVTVPAGTGLVEAAAELGVEIPVFCYEPRIGPPVGACRMCLVEVEGMPKLQAACSMGVRAGMVVSTVGDRAREAQEAVLEFLLVNHPLDCPVCDKGGECPLQDQAFRWGPGASRFRELKRVNDKPIPISPLIALDRERCILCYRCSRFSAEVSEDLQLIARQRGASSVIATFEGRAYEGTHSGNVIELCPVGALTSTQYRFTGRPWETTDHPSVAPWDVVGSNVYNTIREGRVVRVLSRRNDAVDVGWIDDRTRFAYASMYGPSRITVAQHRSDRDRPVGNRPVVEQSLEVALEWLHDRLRVPMDWEPDPELEAQGEDEVPPARELWVLSGYETLETVFAVQQLAAQTGGRVVAAPGASAAAPQYGARIADLSTAREIVVIGHADLLDTAPALDLRIRRARSDGANVSIGGMGGTRLEGGNSSLTHASAGGLDRYVEELASRVAQASPEERDRTAVVVHRDGELSTGSLELLARTFRLPREGCGFIAIPQVPNARGLAALGVECITPEELFAHTGGVVYLGLDPDRLVDRSTWGPAVKRAAWVVAVDALPSSLHGAADLVIPGAWGAEQEGALVNLEGRLQRITVGAEPPPGVRAPLRWIAGLGRRFGAGVPSHAAGAYRQLAAVHGANLPAHDHGSIPPQGVLGVTGGPGPLPLPDAPLQLGDGDFALYVAPNLFDAAEVAHTDAMDFLHDEVRLTMHRADARIRGLARGDRALLSVDGREVEAVIVTSTRVASGHARVHAGTGTGVHRMAPGRTGWRAASVTALPGSGAEQHLAAATPRGAGADLDAPPTLRGRG